MSRSGVGKRNVKDAWTALDKQPVLEKALTDAQAALRKKSGEYEQLLGRNQRLAEILNLAESQRDRNRGELEQKEAANKVLADKVRELESDLEKAQKPWWKKLAG